MHILCKVSFHAMWQLLFKLSDESSKMSLKLVFVILACSAVYADLGKAYKTFNLDIDDHNSMATSQINRVR